MLPVTSSSRVAAGCLAPKEDGDSAFAGAPAALESTAPETAASSSTAESSATAEARTVATPVPVETTNASATAPAPVDQPPESQAATLNSKRTPLPPLADAPKLEEAPATSSPESNAAATPEAPPASVTTPNFLGGARTGAGEGTATKLPVAGSERHLSGLKPIVPLRKRGQSFRETKKITTTVDADGRRHLNQYTFMEQLGRGAYGLVMKVQCNETKELFAAKMVDKKALKRIRVGRFGNALQSVKKELNIWRRFKHRHIVVLREVIDTDDSDELFMISELVEGGPVLDDERECTPLNAEKTKTYFTHLIEGIDFLHENKIIHRDIKPGNLLLKTFEDGETVLKIADFGVSHEMENDNESMRQTAGTAIFMSPEMLTGENFQGKPVDIWACGVTLYMFVYGHPPFVATTMTELYGRIQHDEVVYVESVGDRVVEKGLIDLLKHILEKDPVKRFTSKQIRAHPWAWREFQSSAMRCVTNPDGKRTSFSSIPKGLAGVASIGKSMRSLFGRPSAVFPGATSRSSLPAVMSGLSAPTKE